MRTHHNAWRVVDETPLCVRTIDVRTHQSRRGRAPGVYKKDPLPHSLFIFHSSLLISSLQMTPKGKAKIHWPPTRFSLRLAACRARQPIDKAETSSRTPAKSDSIIISSDSEENLDSSSEKEEPGLDPQGSNHGEDSSDEEVPEYIPEDGPTENQDPRVEEPEGPGADHEIDPNPDPEEPEEDPEEDLEEEEDPEEDPEMGEEEEEAEQDPNDDEDFADYFELPLLVRTAVQDHVIPKTTRYFTTSPLHRGPCSFQVWGGTQHTNSAKMKKGQIFQSSFRPLLSSLI
ncbi:hypothetical protein PIB30_044555 [Stylosanthes scabra]|uniref:Uncharacterized protein n=1 Tax=Stylosanthes scabra TaxID=79078 RepID=A0ABU6UEJ2_9FABA|nr:hypothetical protein [Stylosanthes scabra]